MQTKLTRRGAMSLTAGAGLAACRSPETNIGKNEGAISIGAFTHGVASGDPFSTSVVLWTRVSPNTESDINITWEVSRDKSFNEIARSGQYSTNKARDYCVKVIADKLDPGQTYYYRFRSGETLSAIGRTRTLATEQTQQLRFAVVSCSNWQHGYFNVYDAIAKRAEDNPYDAMIHLGDYYYEYRALENPRLSDRTHQPAHEIVTLEDYRQRHAQYRSDPALQSATAAMPLIAVWDDHETSNDSWVTGAENHQVETEGNWDARKQAALRAYYEWMPIREPKVGRVRSEIYRNFRFGDLANITCVETRLTARAEPIIVESYIDDISSEGGAETFRQDVLNAPDREMFGADQQSFIIDAMRQSKQDGVAWRMLANQVIMARLLTPDFSPYIDEISLKQIETVWPKVRDFVTLSKYNMPLYPDSWEGYPVAREKFYAALEAAGLRDMLVLTGDAHEFWVNELTSESGEKYGLELVTSSISSETLTAFLGDGTSDHNLLLTQKNGDARFYDATRNGFIDLTLTHKKAAVTMFNVDTVVSREYVLSETASFTVRKSKDTIKATSPKGLSVKQRALFHGIG